MKRSITLLCSLCMTCGLGVNVFAADVIDDNEFANVIPQIIESEKVIIDNGHVTHEYVWRDSPVAYGAEDDCLDNASWNTTTGLAAGDLKHRAAKVFPDKMSSTWYACSQTDYAAWHYSRAQIIKRISGKILQDSNQVQVTKGVATARTSTSSLYLDDIDFALRSYWGT